MYIYLQSIERERVVVLCFDYRTDENESNHPQGFIYL